MHGQKNIKNFEMFVNSRSAQRKLVKCYSWNFNANKILRICTKFG